MKKTKEWFDAQDVQTHHSVSRGIADFLSKRQKRVDTVLDLWGSEENLLESVVQHSGASIGRGFHVDYDSRNKASPCFPSISWEQPLIEGPAAQITETPDVVLGVPSPYWSPQHMYRLNSAGDRVHLTEDPSNVAMIDSCRKLSRTGVGIFLVGAGVLMRPGPGTLMAKLDEFDLYLEAIIEVPRGLVMPDRGAGQLLMAISQRKLAQPFLGRLNHIKEQVDELLHPREPKGGQGAAVCPP